MSVPWCSLETMTIMTKFFLPVYDWQWEESRIFKMLLSKSASDVVLKLLLGNLKQFNTIYRKMRKHNIIAYNPQ